MKNIYKALLKTLQNPAASSCSDEQLLRVLKNYDKSTNGHLFVEQLQEGSLFKINGERIFKKGPKVRKRFKCQEVSTRKWYLFSAVYEVLKVNDVWERMMNDEWWTMNEMQNL